MTTREPPSYAFPEELLRLPRDGSGVVEASAGTGKTYLLEHLVIDRIVRGEARLEEILVVTFTEKATDELRRRLRAKLDELLAHEGSAPSTAAGRWTLDDAARRRLGDARTAFDRATIRTIHGFCEQILRDAGFASRRLLSQEHVDGQRVFDAAFKSALRETLATDATLRRYLGAWIEAGRAVDDLGLTLLRAHQQRLPWGVSYDEERLARAAMAYAALPVEAIAAAIRARVTNAGSSKSVIERALALRACCAELAVHGDPATLLRAIDELVKEKSAFTWIEERLQPPHTPPVRAFWDVFVELADAAVPLELAIAQLFLPHVATLLAARKTALGLYDFDDMVAEVAAALRGPDGARLTAALRGRYRLAVIDEFQDTDALQWEIFRRVFHDSGGQNPLYVIGDPKQAIYGFRGADVVTYAEARRVIAGGDDPTVTLRRNFRSRQAILDATNAIFDAAASEPYFSEAGLRPAPALRGGDDGDALPLAGPAITLLAVEPRPGADVSKLPMRQVRRTLTAAIASEIARLRRGPSPTPLDEIFVLTRSRIESMQVARALREAGIPHVLYNQEGLFGTAEAREVRDLLAAVDDPREPAQRLRAWLTPFFGLALGDLAACATLPGGHPLEERLHVWRAIAEARDFGQLFDRILDDSGVAQRELLSGAGARRVTNYLHLFDLLRARAAREPASLTDLVGWLGALTEQVAVPLPEDGDVQRVEGEREAVQIMTVHKAKGLEADHVFLFGAFGKFLGQGVKTFAEVGGRKLFAGRPRRMAIEAALDAETASEDQRLLYVALTRARKHLYLPYAASDELEREGRRDDGYWRITGGYRHVHKRLRALVGDGDGGARLDLRRLALVCPPDPDDTPARIAAAARAWRPAAAELALDFPTAALAETRRRHLGIVLTSYTRIKQAHGGYQPPTEVLDEQPAPTPPPADPGRLPGGALSGIFLHAALEKAPPESFAGAASAAAWAARPEIVALFDEVMRRHDRDPAHRADAERMVHAALTTPLPLPTGATLAGVAGAARLAREVEFLFPFPEAAGGADVGFIKGYVDFIFEHEGRTYFGDWKSDSLPDFSPAAVRAHVAANYELQRQLYALALVKMLGIADEADYEARFGGTVYVFLRALPDGLEIGRPSWAELQTWERGLVAHLAPGASS